MSIPILLLFHLATMLAVLTGFKHMKYTSNKFQAVKYVMTIFRTHRGESINGINGNLGATNPRGGACLVAWSWDNEMHPNDGVSCGRVVFTSAGTFAPQ